ncbi:hypothetical protein BO82DRAFT_407274 [Aspergillus uvarum CBS 121591]|uniref:PEBP-like protein n=1 Tax=Aspergillus uvarum CBS 121591 TaxID=1448315 RepID=A0A319BRY9_9EURO|nr:hypothetical protein BO82DRAFT_407274 [Aspergillus uvarum CBS 121591]PYH76326.1 hypothetical protein BO82DRAFT_407274 [Aspergillus uvarum CBS 121591]
MRTATILSSALLAATALAQTPAGSWPATQVNLSASFGNETVTPGLWINPDDVTSSPSIYPGNVKHAYPGTYMILMLDLNIPDSDVTTAAKYSTLVPGLTTNTTTRLHWWGGNYTLEGRTFVNASDALAPYTAPRPRDSTEHTYTIYLFNQPKGYVPPAAAVEGLYYDQTTNARFNFSLAPVVAAVGRPVAATYFVSSATA